MFRIALFFLIVSTLLLQLTQEAEVSAVPLVNFDQLAGTYHSSQKRVFFIDNDGVLKGPEKLRDQERDYLTHSLRTICQDTKNVVWILSARPVAYLKRLYQDIEGLHLAGQHGAETQKYREEIKIWAPTISVPSGSIQKEINAHVPGADLRAEGQCTRVVVLNPETATADGITKFKAAMKEFFPDDFEVQELKDKGVINIFHKEYHKGTFAEKTMKLEDPDFAMTFGDELPDEVMHEIMNQYHQNHVNAFSVVVSSNGQQDTKAQLKLNDYQHVHEFLAKLAE
ncbi:hypothetical protein O181_094590 [Austropuccinia psidii MF-1]|uniref:Trehalose 6-phosphate phosphatase n=1 Tax=Austropuccinia psidii MF-1 TaxID=1389203 RepID=A0A9Q3J3Z7_9BASI|nr:hypothetical protein [Austropuccinia psidii MF-1]